MTPIEVPVCQCPLCQQALEHSERERHRQLLLVSSRLDENQRRWFVALESKRLGYGGDHLLSQITGLDEKTIRRGREELDASLAGNPPDRIRRVGGGRPPVEKKTLQ
jgi:hypothetical protein